MVGYGIGEILRLVTKSDPDITSTQTRIDLTAAKVSVDGKGFALMAQVMDYEFGKRPTRVFRIPKSVGSWFMYNAVVDASKPNPINEIPLPRQDCAKEFGNLIDGQIFTEKIARDSFCFDMS